MCFQHTMAQNKQSYSKEEKDGGIVRKNSPNNSEARWEYQIPQLNIQHLALMSASLVSKGQGTTFPVLLSAHMWPLYVTRTSRCQQFFLWSSYDFFGISKLLVWTLKLRFYLGSFRQLAFLQGWRFCHTWSCLVCDHFTMTLSFLHRPKCSWASKGIAFWWSASELPLQHAEKQWW